MSARDDMADIKSRAEKFIAAYDVMLEIDGGVGGLAIERPDLMPDFDAWYHASDVDHSDTILAVIEALTPRTITTAEELDGLPEGSVILSKGGEDSAQKDGEGYWYLWGGDIGLCPEEVALPASVLHDPEASA